MSVSSYQILDKFLDEFEEDSRTIINYKQIMQNYPKTFVLFVASLFERNIKLRLNDFIDYPLSPLATTYPDISSLKARYPDIITDKIFANLKGYEDDSGVEVLCANSFYDLFGGTVFKTNLKANYDAYRDKKIHSISERVVALELLLETPDSSKYEDDFAKYSDIKDRLDLCTFDIAEKAYLTIKLKRNRVAHDYLNGLSDSLENIRDSFYYYAVLYVLALEDTISSLTDLSSIPT